MGIFKLEIMKKIIIKDDELGVNIRAELNPDVNLEEVFDVFKGMLVACGYSANGIDEYLK